MSKRQQTTGRPKKDRGQSDVPQNPSFLDSLLGNPKNREEYQTALANLINNLMRGFVAILVLAIAAYLVYEFLWIPQQTVVTVNGERITVAQFRERVEFERGIVIQQYSTLYSQIQQQASMFGVDVETYLQQDTATRTQLETLQREATFPDALGQRVLDEIVDETLIQQEFNARGLSLNDEQVNYARLQMNATEFALLGSVPTETVTPTVTPTPLVSPTPSPTPLPTNTPTVTPSPTVNPEQTAEATAEATSEVTAEATELATLPPSPTPSREDMINDREETADIFEEGMRQNDVSQSAINAYYRRQAVRDGVIQTVIGSVNEALYVNARHILVATEEEANQIIAALNAGESFTLLAQAQSTDTNTATRGGEFSWQPVAFFGAFISPAVGDFVETGEIGVISAPLQSEDGWHIIQVHARETRPVSGSTAVQIQQALFEAWLVKRHDEVEAAGGIVINENWPDYLGQ